MAWTWLRVRDAGKNGGMDVARCRDAGMSGLDVAGGRDVGMSGMDVVGSRNARMNDGMDVTWCRDAGLSDGIDVAEGRDTGINYSMDKSRSRNAMMYGNVGVAGVWDAGPSVIFTLGLTLINFNGFVPLKGSGS